MRFSSTLLWSLSVICWTMMLLPSVEAGSTREDVSVAKNPLLTTWSDKAMSIRAHVIPSTKDTLFYCKCMCFDNFTIVPLYMPENPSKPCLSCTRQFCLDQKLPICRGAEVPDLDTDIGTGKEGDIEARCFQRDSPRDQLVVTCFILIVVGLLLTAAIRNRLRAAIAERGRPTDLREWSEALLPTNMLQTRQLGERGLGAIPAWIRGVNGANNGGAGSQGNLSAMSPLPEILFNIPRNPILAVGLPLGLGMTSGLLAQVRDGGPKSKWYQNQVGPAGQPPRWAFGPVWTILYCAMGFASHLAIRAHDAALTPSATGAATRSLELYYAQLGLNLLWTPLFFAFHRKGLALVDILALTGTAAWWTKSLFDLGPVAFGNYNINPGWLGVPYMLWLSTATYLNLGYLVLNQDEKPKRA